MQRFDRRLLLWTQHGRPGYANVAILEARPGSLRLIHPDKRAWSLRLGTMLALVLVPLTVAVALGGFPSPWSDLVFRLGLLAFAIAAAYGASKLSLGFLADHPEAVEENLLVTIRRKLGRGSLPELQVTAWGREMWIAVVASEARLDQAVEMSGQSVPKI